VSKPMCRECGERPTPSKRDSKCCRCSSGVTHCACGRELGMYDRRECRQCRDLRNGYDEICAWCCSSFRAPKRRGIVTAQVHCSVACRQARNTSVTNGGNGCDIHGPGLSYGPHLHEAAEPERFKCDCGAPKRPAAKRCPECARVRNIERGMSLYRTACALHWEPGAVRRAVMWRWVLVGYLRDRDGDKCGICDRPMRFDVSTGARGESDEGATVDHVIPRSHGGSDDAANLRLAHWRCNRARGNRGGGEQLRLVG
jgi:hypothetical protein